jgi:glycosyltransferase involved in cell wall biosynthesis
VTRVLVVCADPGVPVGGTKGASIHLGELAAALTRQGADVLIAAVRIVAAPDVAVARLPGPGRGADVGVRLAAEPEREDWLAERAAAWGADVIYERLALHSAAGGRAARRVGIPHVVELNAPLPREAATYRHLERPKDALRLEREVLAGADLVVAVSRPLADHAATRGARRVEVLPNGVDLARFPVRDGDPPPSAVLCGSLRPWHGVEIVAEAWRLLGPDAPPLLVVGDGPGRPILDAAGAELVGAVPHEQVPPLLARAGIGLAPYGPGAPEYFSPLKVFEYLAAGLAVVAAALPGVVDVVPAGAARLVPVGEPEALAAAVADLATKPAVRRDLARRGRASVAAAHTWDHRACRLLDLVGTLPRAGVRV